MTCGHLHLRDSCWLVVDCSTADEYERKAFLTASRALVAVAARSLAVGDAEIPEQNWSLGWGATPTTLSVRLDRTKSTTVGSPAHP